MQSSCGAFTLIELLVVIAVIAILAAILFPVFQPYLASREVIYCPNDSEPHSQV